MKEHKHSLEEDVENLKHEHENLGQMNSRTGAEIESIARTA